MMTSNELLGTIVRTLTASGYSIIETSRQPSHIELTANATHELGSSVRYLFGITDEEMFSDSQRSELESVSESSASILVLTANTASPGVLSIDELLRRLGGPIPTWRALALDFRERLILLGTNSLPQGESGQSWQLYEEAVSDGLEFLLGTRVKRLGKNFSGSRYPDAICLTPDRAVVVVDAKSAGSGFDASNENLRALREYVTQQGSAQQGRSPLSSGLVVSSRFLQSAERLAAISGEFLSDTTVPLAFLTSETLGDMVELIRPSTRFRISIRWRRVFCVTGLVSLGTLESELKTMSTIQISGDKNGHVS